MKNKKFAFPLIIAIVGMWAFIIYRFMAYTSSGTESATAESAFVPPVLSSSTTDTFSIIADYRDPFLGKTEAKTEGVRAKAAKVTPKPAEQLKWPVITYGGLIKSRKSNDQLCAVVINGQSHFMKEGDVLSEVKLKRVFRDSVEVVFGKEKRVVRK